MARGSFLVSARRPDDDRAGLGGDIIYIVVQELRLRRAEQHRLLGAKADQAHQVRLLAAELGEHGDPRQRHQPGRRGARLGHLRGRLGRTAGRGVRRAGGSELGAFYAQRTLLKREVLPEHVANAVFALTGGDLTHTTGLHIPVDAGVAAAFLR
jgi:enoyl-[acyl-carrier-protein] reductase (NADH)